MPARAATARTVSPLGPSLTSTSSAADSSSRSTSALGVRDRRPVTPASLMQAIFSYFAGPVRTARLTLLTTAMEHRYLLIEHGPLDIEHRPTRGEVPMGTTSSRTLRQSTASIRHRQSLPGGAPAPGWGADM